MKDENSLLRELEECAARITEGSLGGYHLMVAYLSGFSIGIQYDTLDDANEAASALSEAIKTEENSLEYVRPDGRPCYLAHLDQICMFMVMPTM